MKLHVNQTFVKTGGKILQKVKKLSLNSGKTRLEDILDANFIQYNSEKLM